VPPGRGAVARSPPSSRIDPPNPIRLLPFQNLPLLASPDHFKGELNARYTATAQMVVGDSPSWRDPPAANAMGKPRATAAQSLGKPYSPKRLLVRFTQSLGDVVPILIDAATFPTCLTAEQELKPKDRALRLAASSSGRTLHQCIQCGCFVGEPATPTILLTSPAWDMPQTPRAAHTRRNLKIDLLSTSTASAFDIIGYPSVSTDLDGSHTAFPTFARESANPIICFQQSYICQNARLLHSRSFLIVVSTEATLDLPP
jgi:hypothetical protein